MRTEFLETAPPPFEPSSAITDEEAAAMLRAAVNLFGLWKLTDKQAATLLDVPTRSYARWKADGKVRLMVARPEGAPLQPHGRSQGARNRLPRAPARL